MKRSTSPFSLKNIRLFILLRICFNARFYYPVFTVLFLDFGLSLEQFAILNAIWAATIVLAEVPSGALADIIGRRQLLIMTSIFMLLEMALLSFVPLGNVHVIFWVFLVNRVLSGLAEAMASGADEALAYDTLVEAGLEEKWPHVLEVQMRWKAVAAFVTMTAGALIYDPNMVNRVLVFLGGSAQVVQQQSMRFPIYLTLVLALFSLLCSVLMREPLQKEEGNESRSFSLAVVAAAGRKTLATGKWILETPFVLAVILFGMSYDHILRMVVTMTSEYFRRIDLPDASFGIIGATMSLLGIFIPRMARFMVARYAPVQIAAFLALLSLFTLWALQQFVPYWGLLPMLLVYSGMIFTSFFSSHYLNRATRSEQRATVLSFKGLAFNLAYGIIGILFAVWVRTLRETTQILHPDWSEKLVSAWSFKEGLSYFLPYTVVLLCAVTLISARILRFSTLHKEQG